MRHCANCGHELGVGRYCTNCGEPADVPADWRTDTAERTPLPPSPRTPPPSVPPPAPAGAGEPGPPRYPLFADEVEPAPAAAPTQHRGGGGRRWPLWLGVAAVLLVVAAVGVKLLSGDDSGRAAEPSDRASSRTPGKQPGTKESPGKQQSSDEPAPSPPGDVTKGATVDVPATAPAGQDIEGKRVDYDAGNMTDGIPETTWRMAGDGTGKELTITLPSETTLRSVGLINGYAKTVEGAKGGPVDWYHGNRRIQQVEWVFDDGTTVPQTLGDTTSVQSVDVDTTTTTVVLRLVEVTKPGSGPSSRNYTAISDLLLIGGG